MATTTTTTTTTNTLAARAAGLLSKTATLAVAEKAIGQAVAAKRVFPPMAADFSEQLGVDLPLKSKDFVRVVGHLLQSTEKPLKGIISKRKSEILGILSELVGVLTDTTPTALPLWALPKIKAKATEAEASEAEAAKGALNKANVLAEAEAKAEAAEANAEAALSKAVALIVSRAADLTESQRAMLAAVLATEESTEATEA